MNRAMPSREAGARTLGWVLSIMVHGGFVAVLVLGVSWQRHPEPAPMMAEIWSNLPRPATSTDLPAPPVTPVPAPAPAPQPAPPPPTPPAPPPEAERPIPQPPKPAPPVHEARPSNEEAEIALKKKKQKLEREAKAKELEQRREKIIAEQLRQERLEAQKEQHRDAQRRIEAEVQRRKAEQMAQNAQAAQATQVDRYKLAIIQKIRANTEVPEGVRSGVSLEVDITILPDGGVMEPVRIIKPSGDPRYDQAVIRGILHAQPLPLPSDVALRRLFRVTHLQLHHEN